MTRVSRVPVVSALFVLCGPEQARPYTGPPFPGGFRQTTKNTLGDLTSLQQSLRYSRIKLYVMGLLKRGGVGASTLPCLTDRRPARRTVRAREVDF